MFSTLEYYWISDIIFVIVVRMQPSARSPDCVTLSHGLSSLVTLVHNLCKYVIAIGIFDSLHVFCVSLHVFLRNFQYFGLRLERLRFFSGRSVTRQRKCSQ